MFEAQRSCWQHQESSHSTIISSNRSTHSSTHSSSDNKRSSSSCSACTTHRWCRHRYVHIQFARLATSVVQQCCAYALMRSLKEPMGCSLSQPAGDVSALLTAAVPLCVLIRTGAAPTATGAASGSSSTGATTGSKRIPSPNRTDPQRTRLRTHCSSCLARLPKKRATKTHLQTMAASASLEKRLTAALTMYLPRSLT